MRRKLLRARESESESILDISSLIDVCFLLLIYFIVTSTIQPREQDLPMTMPYHSGHYLSADELVMAHLGILDDGSVVMNPGENAELLDSDLANRKLPNTKERLRMMNEMAKSSGSKIMVQVYAMEEVTQQRFIDVMNCLRSERIDNLILPDYE